MRRRNQRHCSDWYDEWRVVAEFEVGRSLLRQLLSVMRASLDVTLKHCREGTLGVSA
jgi:hypothetical protein